MRDWISCLIIAYATQRTLIIESRGWPYAEHGLETIFLPLSTNCTSANNQKVVEMKDLNHMEKIAVVKLPRIFEVVNPPKYLPLSIPEDIAEELTQIHKNPAIWWIGQFAHYLTRQNKYMEDFVEQSISALGFRSPTVGIHVRRTDKNKVATPHELAEYMISVEAWFNDYEKRHNVVQRRVYLASDETDVLIQAKKRYPKYTFVSNVNASTLAKSKETRYSLPSLLGVVLDIQLLSMCDFVVCTLSSNTGRLVYEMMNVRYWDAPDRIRSLDTDYSFTGHFKIKYSDQLRNDALPKWVSRVKDVSKHPKRQMFSLDNPHSRVVMPTYPEVPML